MDWNGTVPLDGPTMEDASLRRAQQICGDTGQQPQCRAEVSGVVYDPFGDMGYRASVISNCAMPASTGWPNPRQRGIRHPLPVMWRAEPFRVPSRLLPGRGQA
ncbi:hypothetical protein RAA17_00830 [Komagataeibacter rhaeticus]|nr:hypothetical protein [Komagataeibacter rhaeticus]